MSTWLADGPGFQALFRDFPTGVVAIDREGTIVASNPAFTRLTGLPADRVVGTSAYDADRIALRVFADEAIEAANAGESLRGDIDFLLPDGSTVWCSVTSIPVTGDDPAHALFVFENLTGRNDSGGAAEVSEVAQLRANFRLLFEHNPSVVLEIDGDHRITDINPAGLRISRYRREDVLAHDVSEFVPVTQRDHLRLFLRQALNGESVSFPIDGYSADGRLIQYEATALPIVSQNRVVGIYGLLENVTDWMRAERTVAAQREELIDLETDFRSLFDHNPDGVVLFSTRGDALDVNDAAAAIAGCSREDLIGLNFGAFLQGSEKERVAGFFARACEGESVRYDATSNIEGREIAVDVTLFPKYAQGVVVGIYCVFQDVTERRIVQRRAAIQAQRIRDLYVLATAPERSEAQLQHALQTGCRLLAMECGAILSATGEIEVRHDVFESAEHDGETLHAASRTVLESGESAYVSAEDSDVLWIGSPVVVAGDVHGTLVFTSRRRALRTFEDVDRDTVALISALVASTLERRRARGNLRRLAYFDSLTGLPNRARFQERLRDAIIEAPIAGSIAVMYFDLDRFKDINDTVGHAMGDRFLKSAGERLRKAVADAGMVARLSGDEFAVLINKPQSIEKLHELSARLLREMEQPFMLDGYELYVTTSIGVATFPSDARDDQTLIKNADMAMYEVKDRGGNGYAFYDASLEVPILTRLAQEKLMRRGIEEGQFTLHYQPIFDVESGSLAGVEALVRWNDPERGLVYPDSFIPAAEASGLIVRLGEWIVDAAAREIRAWHRRGVPLCLAVNISARQLHQPNLFERLRAILANAELDPEFVEIEITESMAISNIPHAVETVHRLKDLGARIGVDDFGTGHSSLSYLRRYEVDHIKIDRSFISGIGSQETDETIVRAIVAMGHSLGLKITAEGVETPAQLEMLRAYGCDRAQGYLLSRPLDGKQLEAFISGLQGGPRKPA